MSAALGFYHAALRYSILQDNTKLASIVIVTHNNEYEIRDCLRSIQSQQYTNFEIILVDNDSTDDTIKIVKEEFLSYSNLSLIENDKNLFYAGGNNIGYQKSKGEWVAFLNPDIQVDKLWLAELMAATKKYQDGGIFCSSVLLYENKETINACGNEMHLSGLVFSRLYGKKECECKEEEIFLPSGAAFLFNKKILHEIGQLVPFNEEQFPMEFSDIDLALRLLSIGKRCLMVPSSKVYHKYRFKLDPKRFEYLEKCRYRILCHLTKKTRLAMIPTFLATEIIVLSFALKNHFFLKKFLLYFWLLKSNKLPVTKSSTYIDYKIISKMTTEIRLYEDLKANQTTEHAVARFNTFFKNQQKKILAKLACFL